MFSSSSRFIDATFLLLIACLATSVNAAEVKPLEIGQPAPDFTLKGVDGEMHSLEDYAEAKVLAIIFTCNHCPTAQAYEGRIKNLAGDYQQDRVAVVAISPNDPKALRLNELGYTDLTDTYEAMKIRARDHDFNFPYLYDGDTQKTSKKYGPLSTPHVFIFGPDRKLRYEGGIDDDQNPAKVEKHHARNAIEALLNDKSVPTQQTNVFGCSIKWSDKLDETRAHRKELNEKEASQETIDLAGVKKLLEKDTDKTRLINAWASWCGPCIAKMDELRTIHRQYGHRDFKLIMLSMDAMKDRDQALKALNEHNLNATHYIFKGDNTKLINTLDEQWRGTIPFSLLLSPEGEVLYRESSTLDTLELKRAIVDEIGRTYFAK